MTKGLTKHDARRAPKKGALIQHGSDGGSIQSLEREPGTRAGRRAAFAEIEVRLGYSWLAGLCAGPCCGLWVTPPEV